MNLLQQLQNDKLTIIATFSLAMESANKAGLKLEGSIKSICEQAGVNRTFLYQKRQQMKNDLELIETREPGRPATPQSDKSKSSPSYAQLQLKCEVLGFCLDHPGAVVKHASKTTYSLSFKRFALELRDRWQYSDQEFSEATGIPIKTLRDWRTNDQRGLLEEAEPLKKTPVWPCEPNELCRQIAADFIDWQGSTRDFLKHERRKLLISPRTILSVLRIAKLISPKTNKAPRHRGSTVKATPGAIIVTDGKELQVDLEKSGQVETFNWQGTVDQATACHTAVVVTRTENAESVKVAYEETTKFLGKAPLALLHDRKPIHDDNNLRTVIEAESTMIAATPGRPENKAVIEGEFGKFEQQVGTIHLDDTNQDSLVKSAVREVIRAYTAGINHAGRAEFDGKSRVDAVRYACPDPKKDKKLIAQLAASHSKERSKEPLPTMPSALALLNAGYEEFGLTSSDPLGTTRDWLSKRFEPEAIRQALAIFGTKIKAGALQGEMTHRYLIKVIQGCQDEISLREEEALLLKFAEVESKDWHRRLEGELDRIKQESESDEDLAKSIAECALFGGVMAERAFWESQLQIVLYENETLSEWTRTYVRRLYEAERHDRFVLLSKIISWESKLAKAS